MRWDLFFAGFVVVCNVHSKEFGSCELVSSYIDLVKKMVANTIYEDPTYVGRYDPHKRECGADWPAVAHTMIGIKRLENIQQCVESVLERDVPGDLVETGVWRGGATIFMRAILKAYGEGTRKVWVADSFEGLPPPNPQLYPADAGLNLNEEPYLAVSLEQVQNNFRKYGLLDGQVQFLKGFFRDTLPKAPIEKISVLRLDGDLYESTMDTLRYLYPKLSVGGYVIIDDYGAIEACARAVHDYRRVFNIQEPMIVVDWTGVYWQKTKEVGGVICNAD